METQRPTSVELDGAPATKFVLLSIVVAPFAPSGRPTKAAAPPSVPVKLMTARRCAKQPRMQRADRTTMRAATGVGLGARKRDAEQLGERQRMGVDAVEKR